MNIFIDIETVPAQDPAVRAELAASITPPGNISKAETIAAWERDKKPLEVEQAWRRTSFDGAVGHIAVIGYAIDDLPPVTLFSQDWLHDERQLLARFYSIISENCHGQSSRPVFVGHNLHAFDLRFMWHRSVVLGVKPAHQVPFKAKAWDERIFDTMLEWSGGDKTRNISQDRLCRALGFPGKGDMDGSKVWDYVADGRIDEVAAYCARDVEAVRQIHRRMTFSDQNESMKVAA